MSNTIRNFACYKFGIEKVVIFDTLSGERLKTIQKCAL